MTATPPARHPARRSNTLLYILMSLLTLALVAIAIPLYLGIFQQASNPQGDANQQPQGPSENISDFTFAPGLPSQPTIQQTPSHGFRFPDRTLSPHGIPLASVTESISLLSPTSEIRVINLHIDSPTDDHGIRVATDTCSQTESLSKATSCHITLEWLPEKHGRLRNTLLAMEIRPPEPLPGQPARPPNWAPFRHVVPISAQLHPAPPPIQVSMLPFNFNHPIPGETLNISRRLEVRNRAARILLIRRKASLLSMQQAFDIDADDCNRTLTPPPGGHPAWCEITASWSPAPGSPPLDAQVNVYYVEAATPEHPDEGPRQTLVIPVTSPSGIEAEIPPDQAPATPGTAAWEIPEADFNKFPSGSPTRIIRTRLFAKNGPIRILDVPDLFASTPHERSGLELIWDDCLEPGVIPANHDCPMNIQWNIPATPTTLNATVILRWSADTKDALPQELPLPVFGSFVPPQPELILLDPSSADAPQTPAATPERRQPPQTAQDTEETTEPQENRQPAQTDADTTSQPEPQPPDPLRHVHERLEDILQRPIPEPIDPNRQPEPEQDTPSSAAPPQAQPPPGDEAPAAAAMQPGQVHIERAQSSFAAGDLQLAAARDDLMRRRSIPVLDGAGIIRIQGAKKPEPPKPRWTDPDYTMIGIPRTPGESSRPVNLSATILAGTPIPAVLDFHINALQPTPVTATVTRDIYASHGSSIVIPRGSKAIGFTLAGNQQPGATQAADSFNTAFAQRIQIHWTRLIRPDGAAFAPASEIRTTDLMGRPGLPGRINRRELASFLSALSTIALQAGTTALLADDITRIVSAQAGQTGTSDVVGSPGDVISNPGDANTAASTTHTFRVTPAQQARQQARMALTEVLQSQFAAALPPPPTVTAAAGSRMQLVPAVDLWLTPAIPAVQTQPPADPAQEDPETPQILTTTFPLTPEERNPSQGSQPEPYTPAPDPYTLTEPILDAYSTYETQIAAPTPQPETAVAPEHAASQGRILQPAQPPSTNPGWR